MINICNCSIEWVSMSVVEWLKELVIVFECIWLWSNVSDCTRLLSMCVIVWVNLCDCYQCVRLCDWMYYEGTGTILWNNKKNVSTTTKHLPRRNFTCRIISVEGTKAVINSTITPNMTFTKTSQKFGQWSDVRANTVYGLGKYRYSAVRCSEELRLCGLFLIFL